MSLVTACLSVFDTCQDSPDSDPVVREFGSFFVEEAAPGFGGLSGVAVGAEGDSVEDSVVSASDSWDAVVELEVDPAEIFRVAVGVGAVAALPAPQCVSQLSVGACLQSLRSVSLLSCYSQRVSPVSDGK